MLVHQRVFPISQLTIIRLLDHSTILHFVFCSSIGPLEPFSENARNQNQINQIHIRSISNMFPISGSEFSHGFFCSHVAGEVQARQEALRRRVVDGSDELRVLKDSTGCFYQGKSYRKMEDLPSGNLT